MSGRRHPALSSWFRLTGEELTGVPVEALKEGSRSRVYRLAGTALESGTVIAKRCPRETALLEQAISRVLGAAGGPVARHYGVADDGEDDFSWQFFSDAGDERLPAGARHTARLGRLLALVHGSLAHWPGEPPLKRRNPSHYLALLQASRDKLTRFARTARLKAHEPTLRGLIAALSVAEQAWPALEVACGAAPEALVHGDFALKHVRHQSSRPGSPIVILDWEDAGRGTPAADLSIFAHPSLRDAGIPAYVDAARAWWPDARHAEVQALVEAGRVLRAVASIEWETGRLAFDWLERPLERFGYYAGELDGGLVGLTRWT